MPIPDTVAVVVLFKVDVTLLMLLLYELLEDLVRPGGAEVLLLLLRRRLFCCKGRDHALVVGTER